MAGTDRELPSTHRLGVSWVQGETDTPRIANTMPPNGLPEHLEEVSVTAGWGGAEPVARGRLLLGDVVMHTRGFARLPRWARPRGLGGVLAHNAARWGIARRNATRPLVSRPGGRR